MKKQQGYMKREMTKLGKQFERKVKIIIDMKTKSQNIQIKIEMTTSIIKHIEVGNDKS